MKYLNRGNNQVMLPSCFIFETVFRNSGTDYFKIFQVEYIFAPTPQFHINLVGIVGCVVERYLYEFYLPQFSYFSRSNAEKIFTFHSHKKVSSKILMKTC